MYVGLHVKYPLFLSYFNEIWILSTFFKNPLTLNKNPWSGSRVDAREQAGTQMEEETLRS